MIKRIPVLLQVLALVCAAANAWWAKENEARTKGMELSIAQLELRMERRIIDAVRTGSK
jgi:hypothetical protein